MDACPGPVHKDPEETKHHFPNIYAKCLSIGIDITKQYIPVAPCAHYMCGGIKVDLDGQSSIHRLYAVGECSCTGLHGGNRLASNSLIEAVVYADAAAKAAATPGTEKGTVTIANYTQTSKNNIVKIVDTNNANVINVTDMLFNSSVAAGTLVERRNQRKLSAHS